MGNMTVPTLSTDGFITDRGNIMVKLFEYLITSNYSQSNIFINGVSSLKYIVAGASDGLELVRAVKRTILDMYVSYYDTVDVDVDLKETDSNISIYIDIRATYDDKEYVLTRELRTHDGVILNDNNDNM